MIIQFMGMRSTQLAEETKVQMIWLVFCDTLDLCIGQLMREAKVELTYLYFGHAQKSII